MFVTFSQLTKHSSCRLVGLAAVLAALAAGLVLACDTPVYRYAMYRWEPAPYEVYFFHDKPLDEQAAQVQKLVEAASRSEENPANLFFVPVSLSDDPELKKIPPDVRKAWQDQKERQLPSYLVGSFSFTNSSKVRKPPSFFLRASSNRRQAATMALPVTTF